MAQEESTHFVAHLKIEKVDRRTTTSGMVSGNKSERNIDEVTQLTIKAESLNALVEKLGKHIAIIEES